MTFIMVKVCHGRMFVKKLVTRVTLFSEFFVPFRRYYQIEEHDMLNWLKANRKRMNSGELKEERLTLFKELQELSNKYKRVNQYV